MDLLVYFLTQGRFPYIDVITPGMWCMFLPRVTWECRGQIGSRCYGQQVRGSGGGFSLLWLFFRSVGRSCSGIPPPPPSLHSDDDDDDDDALASQLFFIFLLPHRLPFCFLPCSCFSTDHLSSAEPIYTSYFV